MLRLSPATEADYSTLSDIESAAFSPSLISQTIFSGVSPSNRRTHASKRFKHELRNPQKRLVKAERNGEILGWAQWEVPLEEGQEAFSPPQEEGPGWAEGTNVAEAETFFPKLDLGIKEPHYLSFSPWFPPFLAHPSSRTDLSILVVDPSKQKTGAGRALLQWGIERADKEGKDIYLESSPIAVEVYPKFGFESVCEPIRGGTQNQLVVYPMRRRPGTSAASKPPSPPSATGELV
ncbi:hypothetical protein JCM8097_000110 [Rhodosporidiobolus ruineniae]